MDDKQVLLAIATLSGAGYGDVQLAALRSAHSVTAPALADAIETLEGGGHIRVERVQGGIAWLKLTATGREVSHSLGAAVPSPRGDARELRQMLLARGDGESRGRQAVSLGTLSAELGWEVDRVNDAALTLEGQGFARFARNQIRIETRQITLTVAGRR